MKFLCDRCRTRYSIGDERVRGKILKIRCKNCANVITVREGMSIDSDGVSVATELPGRKQKPTTTAPEAMSDANAGEPSQPAEASPAAAARAARSSSRQGAAAKESVGNLVGKDAPAKEPAAKAPAAMTARLPAGASVMAAAAPAKRTAAPAAQRADAGRGNRGERGEKVEPSSALGAAYASAMAKPPPALEEEWYVSIDGEQSGPFSLAEAQRWVAQQPFDADLHCWSEGFDDWLPVDKVSHFRGLRKKPAPPPLPRLGSAGPRASTTSAPAPASSAASEATPKPLFAATMASLERSVAAPPAASARSTPPQGTPVGARPEARSTPRPVNGSAGARSEIKTLAAGPATARMVPFDTSDGEAATELSAPQFHDAPVEPARPVEPSSLEANAARNDAVISAAASDFESGAHGDELDIGEVSRVVNLADIMRGPRGAERPAGRQTGAIGRLSGTSSTLRPGTASHRSVNPPLTSSPAPTGEMPPEPDHAPATRAHHRGLIALFTVATVMVVGGVAAVVLFVTSGDDTSDGTLGPVHNIDTSRPEDPITHRPIEPGATGAPNNPAQPQRPNQPRITRPNSQPPIGATNPARDETPAPGDALRSDEIEDAARKHQEMTQRCYQRSQRGSDSIIIGDVKKITVTMTVDKEGKVSELALSEHADDNLGKCLASSIRGWKFRPSAGGTFKLSLAFAGG